jgi:exodeoxyribonuclease VII small subunit
MGEIKFEQALAKLEKIVEELESGKLSLEEAIAKYEEGMRLSKACSRKLEAARKRIEILVKSDKDKLKTKPFSVKGEFTEEKVKRVKKESEEESLF